MQGYLAHKKHQTPQDHYRSLGISLRQGPTGWVFVISEVSLYRVASESWRLARQVIFGRRVALVEDCVGRDGRPAQDLGARCLRGCGHLRVCGWGLGFGGCG